MSNIKKRSEIDSKYKWRLEDLFDSEESWNVAAAEAEGINKLQYVNFAEVETALAGKGDTIIQNCAIEPEIVDLANFLNSAGAKIYGKSASRLSTDNQYRSNNYGKQK